MSCKTSGLNSFTWSLQWATSKCNEGCGHNCQQICKFVSLVMRIMDFILMSLFIRMPGGLGPSGGNKLQTLPMHFKTHQCHIKEKKEMFPLLSVHCSFHLVEPDAISYGSFYCCKLISYLSWDFTRIHRDFQMGTCFFHSLNKTGNYHDSLGSRYHCVNTPVPTLPNEIYSRGQHCQSCHSLKTRALLPSNPARNAQVVLRGQSTAPDTHGRTIKLCIIKSRFYYIYYY